MQKHSIPVGFIIDSFQFTFFSLEYEPLEVLGKGISSIVRKCVNRTTGDHYAVKVIDLLCDEAPTRDEVQNEVYTVPDALTSTVYSD